MEEVMVFVKKYRNQYGVEPICKVLQIAPSAVWARLRVERNPALASDRTKMDVCRKVHIERVWKENYQAYGARKIWHELMREGHIIARCTVERLMRELSIQGVVRGKKVKTTHSDPAQPCPLDKVNRKFRATMPNQLWVSDFTYVSSWAGMLYTAFVIDTYADKIVGWKVSSSAKTGFVLDALEQAIHARRPSEKLIHHSDRGGQYLSIKYTNRLVEIGADPSVGSVGDSYDNALAETVIGLYKTELVHRMGPWKSLTQLEWQTFLWVDWFNNRRLLAPIGYIPPSEAEEKYYENIRKLDKVA